MPLKAAQQKSLAQRKDIEGSHWCLMVSNHSTRVQQETYAWCWQQQSCNGAPAIFSSRASPLVWEDKRKACYLWSIFCFCKLSEVKLAKRSVTSSTCRGKHTRWWCRAWRWRILQRWAACSLTPFCSSWSPSTQLFCWNPAAANHPTMAIAHGPKLGH